MANNFDEFFDSPRENEAQKRNSESGRAINTEWTASEEAVYNHDLRKSAGKPPAYPNCRPTSATRNATRKGRLSPPSSEENDDLRVQGSRRVIEAKVPCERVKQDNGELYSDDSFVEEDDGSPSEECSGRRSPTSRTDKRFIPKEIHADGCNAEQSVIENKADLSDYSGSFSEDATENDSDSEVTDVSPLNTPHSPKQKCVNSEPIGLLNANRDSLDLDTLLQTVLHMEKQGRSHSRQAQTKLTVPLHSSRRNYSFTNERIEAIDRENRRLMSSIMKHASDTKKAKAKAKKSTTSNVGPKRISSAAINRAQQQQKIEAENLVTWLCF